MKRIIAIALSVTLTAFSFAPVYGTTNVFTQNKIAVYLKPDITVELNGITQFFYDANGETVYPIIYNGSAYLPIRSVAALMKEPVEWDQASKTVFIGRTLSNPNKNQAETSSTSTAIAENGIEKKGAVEKPAAVSAYLKPDILVMYDFVIQNFEDDTGNLVYPINYNGTTYLSIRAASQLMGKQIEWDSVTKTISIGSETANDSDENTEKEISPEKEALSGLFEQEEILYYEATAKTTSLKTAESEEEKQLLASQISEHYTKAQAVTVDIQKIDTTDYTEEQINAYDKLVSFAESTEYYILILENIAYLSASDSDYSMLADTFLYFAMDSQTKMEEARNAIRELN